MKYLIEIDIPNESIAQYRREFPQAEAVPDDEFRDYVLAAVISAIGEMCEQHGPQFDRLISAHGLLNTYVIRKLVS